MKTNNHDVIISGAGPVGLFLACELALARCSVLILERAEHPHSPQTNSVWDPWTLSPYHRRTLPPWAARSA
ncbi:NAD(P)-binding protein [Puia sp. P3]|uniref:NAD(P)-binding protein n=1 Tax=Puia sp. P3 TaxID=3423952 RepID=UPI003D66B9B1